MLHSHTSLRNSNVTVSEQRNLQIWGFLGIYVKLLRKCSISSLDRCPRIAFGS